MKIDDLIEKYYNGETNSEEEMFLANYYQEQEESSPESDMFGYFKIQKNLELNDSFDDNIINAISLSNKPAHSKNFLSLYKYAAAAVIVLLSAWIVIDFYNDSNKSGIVINDNNLFEQKDIAVEQTHIAFNMIASAFNTANDKIIKLEYIDKSNDILNILNIFLIDSSEN